MQKCHEDVIPMSWSCHGSLTVTYHVYVMRLSRMGRVLYH